MYKHILIPTDGSELSEKAIKSGSALAKTLNAKITGLHIIPSVSPIYYGEVAWIDPKLDNQMRETARAEGNKYLDRVEATAKSAGVTSERVLLESELVWKTIIDTAQARRCDLILMAAHGRGGLSALVLGSETNKVLTHSKIPVLVYR
ncbi:MAG: universal stress protein [Sulfurifustaceae bacterium]